MNKTRFKTLYAALVAIVLFAAIIAWGIGENDYVARDEFADSELYEIPLAAFVDYYIPFPLAAYISYYDDETVGCCEFTCTIFCERVQKNRERVTFNWFPEALELIIGGETIWSKGEVSSGEDALWAKEAMFIAMVYDTFARLFELRENGFVPIPEEDLIIAAPYAQYIPELLTGCCSAPKMITGEHEVRLPCEDGCVRTGKTLRVPCESDCIQIERTYMCTSCGMFAVIMSVYITGGLGNMIVR